ncbi:hypothetical protein TPAR_03714 [Tolypocladium paradoxum]|uniref:Uncharacterized protein n=1 Tax=Tolypocladium paradoxum TaxID=94208 RepID=A0A2S4L0X6_9HYPO|nr:hypothetical protein TPAR_03714 [Tolypocladium paradoxum]
MMLAITESHASLEHTQGILQRFQLHTPCPEASTQTSQVFTTCLHCFYTQAAGRFTTCLLPPLSPIVGTVERSSILCLPAIAGAATTPTSPMNQHWALPSVLHRTPTFLWIHVAWR